MPDPSNSLRADSQSPFATYALLPNGLRQCKSGTQCLEKNGSWLSLG